MKIKIWLSFLLFIAMPLIANAQFVELMEGGSKAYANIREVHHKIQWWAIMLSGAILIGTWRGMVWLNPSKMIPALQKALSYLLYFEIIFCTMLTLIQFEPYWMPQFSDFISWVGDLL